MILSTADGVKYRVVFRHYLPCKPTRVKGKGLCRGEARIPIGRATPGVSVVHADQAHYEDVASGIVRGYLQVFSRRPKTICLIYNPPSNQIPLSQCEAICSPRDVFSKKLGRRIALGRALTELLAIDVITDVQRVQLLADYARKIL